jgi:TRAP-type C4-dicarboxylate transport system substrate-binding protein
MEKTYKLKWLLFHSPVELFVRTATTFADEISKLTNGRVEIEIWRLEDYQKEFLGGTDAPVEFFELLRNNNIQMSQIQTNHLGMNDATDFFAFDMPFLFDSHDHASRVLDGEIGDFLLDSLPEATKVRGLAFTYSGGYRCLASKTPIRNADSMSGSKIGVRISPVHADLATALGAEANVSYDLIHETRLGDENDLVQTTLPRFESQIDSSIHPYVINTRHNMFLTSIVIGEEVWKDLSDADKDAFKKAAKHCAKLERQWSVDDAVNIENSVDEQQRLGIKEMIELTPEETQKLKDRTAPLYEKYSAVFTEGLLDSIRKA